MIKQIIAFCVCFVLFNLLSPKSFASPIINEFSSEGSSDWIEIYNTETVEIDLSKYRIRDSSENNKIDLSGSLPPGGFISFDWSNKLNNGGDIIKLVLTSDNSIADQVSYGDQGGVPAPDSGQTAGRKSDGGSEWVLFVSNSKGLSNNSVATFIPPTPTFTKAPTPTKTPTPTKIPIASKTSSSISKTPTPSKYAAAENTALNQKNSSIKSVKITTTKKSASEFARIEPIIKAEKKNDVKVLGAKDSAYSPYFLLSGIVFLASAGIIFGKKFLKERDIL